MVITRHYTKGKYKFYVKYKYLELCLCLATTTKILCDHLLWTQKYLTLFKCRAAVGSIKIFSYKIEDTSRVVGQDPSHLENCTVQTCIFMLFQED